MIPQRPESQGCFIFLDRQLFFASFGLGASVLVKAFAAAAMGGFGIVGTMVGGLVLGMVETLAAGIISSDNPPSNRGGKTLTLPNSEKAGGCPDPNDDYYGSHAASMMDLRSLRP